MDLDDGTHRFRLPIRDRDTEFALAVDAIFAAAGIEPIKRSHRGSARTVCVSGW